MEKDAIRTYLRGLEGELRRRGCWEPDILAEIESHLRESVEQGLLRGLSMEEAQEQALKRFGTVKSISARFEGEKERLWPVQKILTGIGVLAGLFFFYVDSRPTWDDTGVLAGAILLVCGAIGLCGYRRPWLLALAVGAGIPLHGILFTRNYGSLLALAIALTGAYAGWALRYGFNKGIHSM